MKTKTKGNMVIEINYEFGSEYQKSMWLDMLKQYMNVWREQSKYTHKKNNVSVDVLES